MELWPGKDKPLPGDNTDVLWYELYTERQLLERTKKVFEGALSVYNDIVKRWFPAFNRRHQMGYMLPLRLEGILSLPAPSNFVQTGLIGNRCSS